MNRRRFVFLSGACALWGLAGPGFAPLTSDALCAEKPTPRKPDPKDKCPVCGMFVHKYPDWTAQVLWKDGTTTYFDGAKDFFKLLLDMPKYAPKRTRDEIVSMFVSEYYKAAPIDATKAFYVIGSDVLGPMGHELVPLASKAEAEEFMRDHRGKRILSFEEVTPAVLKTLD
jgi:copper chaperone NosL